MANDNYISISIVSMPVIMNDWRYIEKKALCIVNDSIVC